MKLLTVVVDCSTADVHALVLFNLIQSTLAMTNNQMKESRSFQVFIFFSHKKYDFILAGVPCLPHEMQTFSLTRRSRSTVSTRRSFCAGCSLSAVNVIWSTSAASVGPRGARRTERYPSCPCPSNSRSPTSGMCT